MMMQQGPGMGAGSNPALAAMGPARGGMQQAQSMGQAPAAPHPQMGQAQGPTAGGAMTPQVQPQAPGAQTSMRTMQMAQPMSTMPLSANGMGSAPSMSGGPGGPSYGQQWQQPGGGMGGQQGWQPPWQGFGGGMPRGGFPMPQRAQAPQQSIMRQAMAGGQSNPQQTQNFLHALQQSGAGSNNAYMSSGAQPQQQAQQLIGAPVQDNGGYGQTAYAGGYNQGMGQVSYNNGLAARPNQGGTALDPQGNQFYQGQAPGGQWAQPGNVSYQGGANATNPTMNMPGVFGGTQQAQGPGQRAGGAAGMGQFGGAQPGGPQMSQGHGGGALGALGGNQLPGGMGQGMGGALAGAAAMSDERAKENVIPGAAQTREFLSHLNAWEYDYKDPKHGEGRYVSPMAQELEKTPIGRSAVIDTPEGKMVAYNRLAGVQLAAAADFHKRLSALESK